MKHLLLIPVCLLLLALPALADSPNAWDIIMAAGEDYRLSILYLDPSNVPINLDGNSYKAQFRSAPAPAGTVFATYSTVTPEPASGVIELRLSRAQTLANSGKLGMWDLLETNSAGRTSYLVGGKAAVKPTVTR